MDPYQTLGVDQSADDQQIKSAFRKLAVKYHPDRGGDESKFKEINEAYDKIKTNQKRQQYEASKRFGGDGFNFNFSQGDSLDMQDMFAQLMALDNQRIIEDNRQIEIYKLALKSHLKMFTMETANKCRLIRSTKASK